MNKTLKVSNLPLSIDSSGLEDMFTLVGNVLSARVLCDEESKQSLGRGVVEMATPEEAENGTMHFNGQILEGCRLMVSANVAHVRPPEPAAKVKKPSRRKKLSQ